MSSKILKNKPLVEVILEVKWALASSTTNAQVDPHYKFLLGRLYDRLSHNYPEHEQLPSAIFPDEMSAYMVQHRFRYAANDWPLVQVGPGILTLNDTYKYTWADFRGRSLFAVQQLFEAHPRQADLKVESLLLRYIDAVEFDYTSTNIYDFLREKMKVSLALPEHLFKGNEIHQVPIQFSWQSTFQCGIPQGTVIVRFATGRKEDTQALIWEIMVHTTGEGMPNLPDKFIDWIDAAHAITDDWFFKLIEGELERRFNGDLATVLEREVGKVIGQCGDIAPVDQALRKTLSL